MGNKFTKILLIVAVGIFVVTMSGFAIVGLRSTGGSKTTSSSNNASSNERTNTANSTSPTSTTDNSATASSATGVSGTDLASHKTTSDCWVAINGKVYDVSSYDHPKLDPFTCGADDSSGWNAERKHNDSLLSLVTYVGKLN